MIADGSNPELLLAQKYGHRLKFWDPGRGQAPEDGRLGRAAHRWTWSCPVARPGGPGLRRRGGQTNEDVRGAPRCGVEPGQRELARRQVITIPAEPRGGPPAPDLKRSARNRRWSRHQPLGRRQVLYVYCWGTGELRVRRERPAHPREVGRSGSAASRAARTLGAGRGADRRDPLFIDGRGRAGTESGST